MVVVAFAVMTLAVNTAASGKQPTVMQIRDQTTSLLAAEARSDPASAQQKASLALCWWYMLLCEDSRFAKSASMRKDAAKVRRRLISIATDRAAQLMADDISRPESSEPDASPEEMLRTLLAALPESGGDQDNEVGPAGQGGGAASDLGWQLVSLIERIVEPEFWQSRGGTGVIHYYAPRRAMVVRATTDVHEQIRDLLTALR